MPGARPESIVEVARQRPVELEVGHGLRIGGAPPTVVAEQAAQASPRAQNFRVHLSGREEVVPVATRAQGQADLQLSADGETLHDRLVVANITDVLMSRIHAAPAGQDGPVVVWVYPSNPPPVLISGPTDVIVAERDISNSDLVGPLAGQDLDASSRSSNRRLPT